MNTDERPLVLIWEVTQACEHCRAEAKPGRHPDELTTAEGKALLDGASPESHDAFRGEAGSFEATMRAARRVRSAGLRSKST